MATIVVVDAHHSSRTFLSSLLGWLGHYVIETSDGAQALEAIRVHRPELVISDVLLPVLDGYEFVLRMRGEPNISETKVIFYTTARYHKEAIDAAAACRVKRVLTKPLDRDSMLAELASALGERSLTDPSLLARKIDPHPLAPTNDPTGSDSTVFFIDDDQLMRRAVSATMIQSGLKVETFATAECFLEEFVDEPGCILLDIRMPGMNGMELLETLRARQCYTPAIFLTGCGDVTVAHHAVRLRALDLLQKPADRRTLLSRVYFALQEDAIWRVKHTEMSHIRGRMAQLTAREWDLVNLIVEGRASKEIARQLGISIRTVSIHRAHLMAKTGATNVADLVRMSMVVRGE